MDHVLCETLESLDFWPGWFAKFKLVIKLVIERHVFKIVSLVLCEHKHNKANMPMKWKCWKAAC